MDIILTPAVRRTVLHLAAPWVALGLAASAAHAEGNVSAGSTLFSTHCAECHSVREGKDKKGPSLFGIVGRPAAANPSWVYSDALKQGGFAWTPDKLDAYIAAPGKVVPGGKMKFDGLAQAAERADLIAYLGGIGAK